MQPFEFNTFAVFTKFLRCDFGVNAQKVLYFLGCIEKKEFTTFDNITTVLQIPVATAKRVFKQLKDNELILLDNKTYSYKLNKNFPFWCDAFKFALANKQFKGGKFLLIPLQKVEKLQDIEFIFLNTKVAKDQNLDENTYLLCELFFRLGRLSWGIASEKNLAIRATKKELAEFLGFSEKTIYTYNQKILQKYGLDYINNPSDGYEFGEIWANLHEREDCLTYAKNLNKSNF